MAFGVYGKHPARGDFLDFGLPQPLLRMLEKWLDEILAGTRTALGPAWETIWDTAPPLHFWLGEGIWGEVVAGVMAPGRDRVGRRFPLIILATGADVPPPPITSSSQDWYSALATHLKSSLSHGVLNQTTDLLPDGIATIDIDLMAPTPPMPEFWAVRPGADAATLWSDVVQTDHRAAAVKRSYWWMAGEEDKAEIATTADPEVTLPEDGDPEINATSPDGEAPLIDVIPEDPSAWLPADLPESDASPFDGAGSGLFAPPEPATGVVSMQSAAVCPIQADPMPRHVRWSQIWAGEGLPSGAVFAWFFRGHAAND